MNVDQPDTTTTCEVCLDSDGPWVRAEIGLGARSMLIQPIEGDGGAVWVPYVDVRQLDEVDRSPTAAPGIRHLEIGLRDGRRPQVMLESPVVEGLLAALSAAQSVPSQPPPRPAEFDIGGPPPTIGAAPAPAPTPAPPAEVSAPGAGPFGPLDPPQVVEHAAPTVAPAAPTSPGFSASPPTGPAPTATSPSPPDDDAAASSSTSRRNAMIIGGVLLALIAVVVLAFVVFAGGESDDVATPDASSTPSTTTAAPPAPSEPSDVLSVTALDVRPVTGDEGQSLYIDFEVRNLGTEDITAYDLLVTVSVGGASPASATFELDCATAPLPAGSSRQGQYRPDDAEANREQFSNCTVGGWPVDPADPAQVGVAGALGAGEVGQTDVQLRSVTLADGTTLT